MSDLFHLKENNTTVKREILAGCTTFFTLAYILLVVPSILSVAGMNLGSVVVATALTGAFASFLMGILANYPFVLGPGITLAVYFTYSVVLKEAHEWQVALGMVFIIGIVLLLLNLLRIRQLIIQAIPLNLRLATTGGLGLFIAFVGLRNAGIVVSHPITFLSFGDPSSIPHLMTAIGLVVMSVLMVMRIPGALFLGIVFVWLLSLGFGLIEWKGLVSLPESLTPTFFQLDVLQVFQVRHIGVLISFLFVALFDTTGTLIGLAEEGDYVEECDSKTKMCRFPRVSRAILPDTTGTILAPLLGTTGVAVYLESAAGMSVGGRTGLTAVTASVLFLIALFFAPFVASVPHFATAPALIIIGGMMLKFVGRLDWDDPSEWIPAFATLILIPLTLNIAVGISVGYITCCLIKLLTARGREVHWLSWVLSTLFILKFVFFPAS